ncbi:MAG: hypothetical protein U0401_10250 [Anaerolineae bacterium]
MIKREPILEQAAYIIVFNIGLELLIAEFFEMEFPAWEKFLISASTLVLCIVYARVKPLHALRPILHWFAEGMGIVNEFIEWVFKPIIVIFKSIFGLASSLFAGGKSQTAVTLTAHNSADPDEGALAQTE